ncbi:MAG: peptide-methionine (R)-S-oxide reductase MsrB [Opitutales bacterium]
MDPDLKKKLKNELSPVAYQVVCEEGTEKPFTDNMHDLKDDGVYVSVVTGKPLFDSRHKFDSGTGWPSFFQPVDPEAIETREDRKFFMTRTEVHEKETGAHLGHVFPDGPEPTGLRYCMNGAALKFIPREQWESQQK